MNNYELSHHGIKGQQWGVRRYQYEDGTYTEEGKARLRENFRGMSEVALQNNKEYLDMHNSGLLSKENFDECINRNMLDYMESLATYSEEDVDEAYDDEIQRANNLIENARTKPMRAYWHNRSKTKWKV